MTKVSQFLQEHGGWSVSWTVTNLHPMLPIRFLVLYMYTATHIFAPGWTLDLNEQTPFIENIPTVYRSALDKLEPPFVQPGSSWPPTVTRIPGEEEEEEEYSDICDSSCLFLLPLRIGEQESNARKHLVQIAQLALELNRTLVLPNVGKSRLGSCFRWDFTAYYEGAEFSKEQRGRMRVVNMAAFKRWLERRSTPRPKGQIVSITLDPHPENPLQEQTANNLSDGGLVYNIGADLDPKHPGLAYCLTHRFPHLNLDAFSPLFLHPSASLREKLKDTLIGHLISKILSLDEIYAESFRLDVRRNQGTKHWDHDIQPDVLVLNWDLRHPVFSSTSIHLNYSSDLAWLASKLAPPRPYISIHWRMETVSPEVLPRCALSLVDTLADLISRYHLNTVWFASDYMYPISDANELDGSEERRIPTSGTFKEVVKEHRESVEILRNTFRAGGRLQDRTIVGLWEALQGIRGTEVEDAMDPELLSDPGVLGILDKMILMHSTLFVAGGSNCARSSSYTRQVIEARKQSVDMDNGIANIVELFN